MKLSLFAFFQVCLFCAAVSGQISITAVNVPYTQDFDTLANTGTGNTWTDNVTLVGWYSNRTAYNAGTGSINTGAMYSFGAAASTERALGSVASGTTGTIFYGVRLRNDTANPITSLEISYVGEQWRNGGNTSAHSLTFEYRQAPVITDIVTGSYTAFGSLNFTTPITGATAGAIDGNASGNRIAITATLAVNIPVGQEIMLRWVDIDDSGNDHGMGIDDFSVIPMFSPPTSANLNVEGRVTTASGRGIGGASVRLAGVEGVERWAVTNPFGYYRFAGLAAGGTYFVTVGAKRFTFANPTRTVNLDEDIIGLDFVSEQ